MKLIVLLILISSLALASPGAGFAPKRAVVSGVNNTVAGNFPAGANRAKSLTVVIDFDKTADGKSVDVSLTGRLVANSYLAAFGVTLSDVTQGTQVVIVDLRRAYEGQAIRAVSGNNALAHVGSNDPVSFTINFKSPLQAVEFTRPPLIAGPTGVTFPEWNATALDAKGQTLDTAGEGLGGYYSDAAAKTFTLKGPGIKSVRFDSKNHHFAAFNAVIIDDLTLVY